MTVHISALGAAILVVGCFVGYLVFAHTKGTPGPATKGDVVGAIVSAVAVITALLLLLGGGIDSSQQPTSGPGSPLSEATSRPGIPAESRTGP
ncbi:hypothetical protein [Streptomyces sp. NPDC002994]|uniref:hypothetical protein n=1 Tax=Streptomyces sp. NPDC002994 TaxID=3154441 RepID=UPI0033B3C42D